MTAKGILLEWASMAALRRTRPEAPLVVDPNPEPGAESPSVALPEQPILEPVDESDDDGAEVGDIAALSDPSYREWIWWVYRMRSPAELQKDPKARHRVVVTKIVGPLDA